MKDDALGGAARRYIYAVAAVGLALQVVLGSLVPLARPLVWAFVLSYAIVRRPVPVGHNSLTFSLGGAVLLASLYAGGLAASFWVVAFGDSLVELCLGRRDPAKSAFNVGQHSVAIALAHAVLTGLGGGIPAWMAGGVAYSLANWVLAGVASALIGKAPVVRHVSELARESAEPFLLLLLLAIGGGLAAQRFGLGGLAAATAAIFIAGRQISLSRLQAGIFDQLPLGIAVWDRRGRCTYANRAMAELSGRAEREWRGARLTELPSLLAGPSDSPEYLRALQSGQRHVERLRLHPGVGDALPVELTVHPWLRSGELWGALTILRDIRADLEAELNARLAAVGRLASSAAHEIRNPLTSVRGFLQLAERHVTDGPKHWIGLAIAELDRITAIVRDLMVYAQPRRRSSAPVEVRGLLRDALHLIRERAAAQDVTIRVESAPGTPDLVHVSGDRNELKQVLLNLFRNALEALSSGGSLAVQLAVRAPHVVVRVRDDGPGMQPHVRERLFEPFFTTKERGAGLGLMICRQIVTAHGGTIEVHSDEGQGTTVVLQFPLPAEVEAAAPRHRPA